MIKEEPTTTTSRAACLFVCLRCVDNDVDDNTKSINQSILSKKVVYADDDEGRILVVSKQQPRQTDRGEERTRERKRLLGAYLPHTNEHVRGTTDMDHTG